MQDLISLFVLLLFLAGGALLRRAQDRSQRENRGDQPPSFDEMPESTRRILFGDEVEPKEAKPRTRRKPGEEPSTPGREILESLLGEEEEEWQPVHQPARRQELPRQIQEAPTRPQRQTQRRSTPREPAKKAPQAPKKAPPPLTSRGDLQRQQSELRRHQEEARVARQRAAKKAPNVPSVRELRKSRSEASEFFSDLKDLRRGIIIREVLGKPEGLNELPGGPKAPF